MILAATNWAFHEHNFAWFESISLKYFEASFRGRRYLNCDKNKGVTDDKYINGLFIVWTKQTLYVILWFNGGQYQAGHQMKFCDVQFYGCNRDSVVYFVWILRWRFPVGYRWGRGLLTHWARVTHICVGNLAIIGSDNGLSPSRRQAIIWTNAGIL